MCSEGVLAGWLPGSLLAGRHPSCPHTHSCCQHTAKGANQGGGEGSREKDGGRCIEEEEVGEESGGEGGGEAQEQIKGKGRCMGEGEEERGKWEMRGIVREGR